MKAAIVEAPGKLVLADLPVPSPGRYQCLCKTLYCATCSGTDLKLLHNHTPWENKYPAILGHESVGEVVSVGEGVRHFSKGDIVLRPAGILPGQEIGGYHSLWGALSEYGVVVDARAARQDGVENINPYSQYQMKIPTSWKETPASTMLITFKETLSWMQYFGLLDGKSVCVVGTGAVGLFYIREAKMMHAATVCALGRREATLGLAAELGADHVIDARQGELKEQMRQVAPEGFDIIVDAAGVLSHIDEYIPFLKRPGGVVGVYGMDVTKTAHFDAFGGNFALTFHGPRESDPQVHALCLSLAEKGFFDLDKFYSRLMPFSEVVEGYRLLEEKKEFRIVFEF